MGLLPHGGRIASGSIKLDGLELVGLNTRRLNAIRGNDVAMIFQDSSSSLNPTKTIGYQVAEPLLQKLGLPRVAARSRVVELLELVGISRPETRLSSYPHEFSGGQRQRIMIAIALSCKPRVLIADKLPTTALDVTVQAQILELLDSLKDRLGMAILLITHDMGVVAGRADRVDVMYGGKIVESAGTDDLFYAMRHPYAQALLASIPRLDQERSRILYSVEKPPIWLTLRAGADLQRGAIAHLRSVSTWNPSLKASPGTCRPAGIQWPARWEYLPRRGGAGGIPGCRRGRPEGQGLGSRIPGPARRHEEVACDHQGRFRGLDNPCTRGRYSVWSASPGRERRPWAESLWGWSRRTLGSSSWVGVQTSTLRGRRLRRARRDLQMMFQDPLGSLDPRMRVGGILREPFSIQRMGSRSRPSRRIADLLRDVGLPASVVDRFPYEMSGGQRQRVALVSGPGGEAQGHRRGRARQRSGRIDPIAGTQSSQTYSSRARHVPSGDLS